MRYTEKNDRATFFDACVRRWSNPEYLEQNIARAGEILSRYRIAPKGVVVDIGCGTGVMLPLLEKNVDTLVCMDCSYEMLYALRQHHPGCRCLPIQAYAEEIPLAEGCADWVTVYSAFPHFTDKCAALHQIQRILRPGGHVVVFHTASRMAINQLHSSLNPPLCYDVLPSIDELEQMALNARFSVEDIEENDEHYVLHAIKDCP